MGEEKKIYKSNNRYCYVYILIIILQMFSILYWSVNKHNFYVDELYSMGYASSYTGAGDTAQYITVSEEWKYNEWINNADLKKYLLVSEKEQIFNLSVSENVKAFLSGYNYFWLLNCAESIFGYDIVTARPGIVLNIVLFLIAELVLVVLLHRLKMNPNSIAMCLAMFGFSGFFISLVVYIRFYMLVMMLALLVLLLHHIIWTTDKIWKVITCELLSFALIFLMLKNSETTLPFIGGMIGCFVLGLLLGRKWKTLTVYSSMPVVGVIYVLSNSKYRNILFNLRETEYTKNIFESDIESITDNISQISLYLTDFLIGNGLMVLLWGICILVFILYTSGKGEWKSVIEIKRFTAWFIWLAVKDLLRIQYIINPEDNEIAYLISIIGLIVASIYMFAPLIRRLYLRSREKIFVSEAGYIFVLMGTFIIYSVFIVLTDMTVASRYYAFGVLLFVVVFWYVVDWVINNNSYMKCKWVYGVLAMIVILGCGSPFVTRNVEYIYEEDEWLIYVLRDYQGMDTVLLNYVDEQGTRYRHEVYDCVYLMNEDTAIYPVDVSQKDIDCDALPEEFLVWNHVERDADEIMDKLQDEGYQIEKLGESHVSKVYYVRNNMKY